MVISLVGVKIGNDILVGMENRLAIGWGWGKG